MGKHEPTFEIKTGNWREKITAPDLESALKMFWGGKDISGAGNLLMFREIPWNAEYKWDIGRNRGPNQRPGKWHFIESVASIRNRDSA